ncbi:MAG: hypothetical protein JNK50_14285 [Bacteroidia bacterium]|nr:hypothetical protein [Bacteroidia bacterium]
MAQKKTKKPKAIKWPSRTEIRNYVLNDMFTEDRWLELFQLSNTDESWQIGFESIKKVRKEFKIAKKNIPKITESDIVVRISETTAKTEEIQLFKEQIKSNITTMISVLKVIQSSKM